MEKVQVDPKGDVCLITTSANNGNHVGFVVDSKVLTLASDVFAALLGPHFSEGYTLRHSAPATVIEVPLKDDDPRGMRIFLDVLHHRPAPEKVNFEELACVAILVDKYHCQHVFRTLSTSWIKQSIRKKGASKDLPEFLGIAIAFQNPEMFAVVSAGLAITTGVDWNEAFLKERVEGTVLADIVRNWICKEIDAYTEKIKKEMTVALVELPWLLNNKDDAANVHNRQHHSELLCRHDEAVVAGYGRNLREHDMYPHNAEDDSVLQLCLRLPNLANGINKDTAMKVDCRTGTGTNCTACAFMENIEDKLFKVFINVIGRQGGLCYECSFHPEADEYHFCSQLEVDEEACCEYSSAVRLLFGDNLPNRLLGLKRWKSVEGGFKSAVMAKVRSDHG